MQVVQLNIQLRTDMTFNESDVLFALWTLQRDRNRGIPLDAKRAAYYRDRAATMNAYAAAFMLPDPDRGGSNYLCAATMIEAEHAERKAS